MIWWWFSIQFLYILIGFPLTRNSGNDSWMLEILQISIIHAILDFDAKSATAAMGKKGQTSPMNHHDCCLWTLHTNWELCRKKRHHIAIHCHFLPPSRLYPPLTPSYSPHSRGQTPCFDSSIPVLLLLKQKLIIKLQQYELVVEPPLWKIMEFVSWDHEKFPTEWKKKCLKPPTSDY